MTQEEENITQAVTTRSNESLAAKKQRKFRASKPEGHHKWEREKDRERMARKRATPGLIKSNMTQEEENITQTATTRSSESLSAKRKRKFRASKPEDYHKKERDESRERMARNRVKKKTQKRALELRKHLRLSDDDVKEIDARVDRQKKLHIREWLRSRSLPFHPNCLKDPRTLNQLIPKRDWHEIDLQVAEFEISVILGVSGIVNDQGIDKLESKGNKVTLTEKIKVKILNKLESKIGQRILAGEFTNIDSTATKKLSHGEQDSMTKDEINVKHLTKLGLKRDQGIIADEVTSIDPTTTQKLSHSELLGDDKK